MLHEIDVQALDPERLEKLVGPERAARFESSAAAARALLEGRRVVNVNSTATGGGVAELLQTLLAYVRGVGVDARWVVIEGDEDFFAITKRIHNHLYGSRGDGGPLGSEEHAHYEQTLHRNAAELNSFIRAGDIVILHDPQTAGLVDGRADVGRAGRLALPCRPRHGEPRHGAGLGVPPRLSRVGRRVRVHPGRVRARAGSTGRGST